MFLISFYSFIPCLSLTVIKASNKQIIKLHNVQRESTVSPHHHITTSPHNHIATLPPHHTITSPHHHITTSLYHRMITSPHHYSTTQSCILQTGGQAQHTSCVQKLVLFSQHQYPAHQVTTLLPKLFLLVPERRIDLSF